MQSLKLALDELSRAKGERREESRQESSKSISQRADLTDTRLVLDIRGDELLANSISC